MTDIVMVSLSGKMINQYTYIKNYVYSIEEEKLLEQKKTEKSVDGAVWQDLFFLVPGKYLIIEVDNNDIKSICRYKHLTVFSKDEFLSNKKRQFPNADIEIFRKVYQFGGFEIVEWKEQIPSWIELPCECLSDIYIDEEVDEEVDTKRVDAKVQKVDKQPQEVEDKLSLLLKEDEKKSQYLIKKKK